jgi:hypothetical protein
MATRNDKTHNAFALKTFQILLHNHDCIQGASKKPCFIVSSTLCGNYQQADSFIDTIWHHDVPLIPPLVMRCACLAARRLLPACFTELTSFVPITILCGFANDLCYNGVRTMKHMLTGPVPNLFRLPNNLVQEAGLTHGQVILAAMSNTS